MKSFRLALAAAGVAAATFVSARAADPEPGYVDIGHLIPAAKGEFVEINLSPALLKFAARIASRQEPEAAEIIGNLKRVRVNVVTLDESNRQSTVEQIDGIRRKLEAEGWTQAVSVREKEGGDNVDIHVKQHGEDAIDGLVVTVLDKKGQAVVVNIVGSIHAEQIAKLADNLDIEPLRHLHIKGHKKAADHEES